MLHWFCKLKCRSLQ